MMPMFSEIWIDGVISDVSQEKIIFSPDGYPNIKVNIACSYPGEDYLGVDPCNPVLGGKCILRGEISGLSNNEYMRINVWDDDCDGGAGTIYLPESDLARLSHVFAD